MSSQQHILEHGNWQYLMVDQSTTHRRRKGTEKWEVVEAAPVAAQNKYKICMVRQNQSYGEPLHWSLFIYQEGIRGGMMMQVKGDAIYMHHLHAQDTDLFQSESFRDQFDLGTVSETQRNEIWAAAHQIVPPRADSQAQVVENCQGWTIRFVQWLVQQRMVSSAWIESLRNMMEPV
jgi:hypothetical protein